MTSFIPMYTYLISSNLRQNVDSTTPLNYFIILYFFRIILVSYALQIQKKGSRNAEGFIPLQVLTEM